ncbi:non-oxidative hydroxyarylic acid decarboxylases subunit D [Streptomyces celluloflavus]|uniref:non-oxidative hydroxyarylic acid decarboxylases subunit D n=1 Tax=Streptomyces celluloflavus TaxID=58344 RepID=UPI0036A009C4
MTATIATPTECPRCGYESLQLLYSSPVAGAWEVHQCRRCLYCWRTCEPDRRTRRDAYPESFKMTAEDIRDAPEVPAVPPLRQS